MAPDAIHRGVIAPENPSRFAARERCPPSPDRGAAALRKEAPTVECVRSPSVGLAFSRLDRLAFGARDREAANSCCMAPQGIPDVLDVEDPEREERASGGLTGGSRPDPTDEP
jgi:hypothetical protein